MGANKRDVAYDGRGIVVKRDLDAEWQGRSTDRKKESDSPKDRPADGRVAEKRFSANPPTAEATGTLDQQASSRMDDPGNVTTRLPHVERSFLPSRSMPRSQTHGPACTCVSCANQRRERLNEILADDSTPALHRRVPWSEAVHQATGPVMWMVLGIAIAVFVLPLTPGPLAGWVDSVHHSFSRSSIEAPVQPEIDVDPPKVELSPLASDAENIVRVYIDSLNAYDSVGILSSVTERFRKSAEDQVFVAKGLGTQVEAEGVAAAEPCNEDVCRVIVTARISGNQFIGADDVTITLTYVVTNVDGVALVDEVLN